ncbi:D-2-hydroxyacid dehydrogenase [Caballeronia sp. LZ065]|uniref:D-2-hydroxyacid dehydrogenase n=1 Tax=Caballeronia sp. LZ065 TaxID=3038571 RepID=UPI002860F91F|nr:D-2-hydroxyacid dehydrogenase [Caballeronia sp. LZ065]MDR5782336.1 D-2-hydroxyacid dehydrogenase [Caballeronia sp. LZ065]
MNIVFLDRATLAPHTRLRRPDFAHTWREYPATAAHEVAERIRDADIVITNKAPIGAAALEHAARVKLVAVAATGTNVIDLEACKARGVAVSNIRDYARHTVPEHTFALIFALRRSLVAYRESVRAGRWEESGQFCFFDHPIRDLAGSTLGVIGDGALGRAVAALGQALGMRVLMSAHKGREGMGSLYTPFDTVLPTSDVITLHCPLTPATRNLIDTPELNAMERRPLLINTARGGLVNEHALGPALRDGRIAGAGFDVATSEPLAAEHPFRALLDLPNFILTPHVAWASEEAVQALADQLTDNLEAFARGAPRNLVIV